MNNILTLNKISKTDLTDSVNAMYARMTSKTRMRYLSVRHQCTNMIFGNTLAIARAGAGVNNIPLENAANRE